MQAGIDQQSRRGFREKAAELKELMLRHDRSYGEAQGKLSETIACADDAFEALRCQVAQMGEEMERLRTENKGLRQVAEQRGEERTFYHKKHPAQNAQPVRGGETMKNAATLDFRKIKVVQHEIEVHGVAVTNHQGQSIGAGACWDGTLRMFSLNGQDKQVRTLGPEWNGGRMKGLYSVRFSKLGPSVLACTSEDHNVYLWDWATGECMRTLKKHTDEVNSIVFHPSQTLACSVADDKRAYVWDYVEGVMLRELPSHTDTIYGATFLGEEFEFLVATCCFDKNVRIFDMRMSKLPVMTRSVHTDDIIGIDYSQGQRVLATSSDDGLICFWDPKMDWQLRKQIDTGLEVKRIAFNADGKYIAAGTSAGSVLVYETDGEIIAELDAHSKCVFDVAWGMSEFHDILVSASHDGTCTVWKA